MKKIGIYFISIALIISGCSGKPNAEQDRMLVVSFSIKSLTTTDMKSATTSDEEVISKVILFGVNNQDAVIEKRLVTINTSLEGFQLTISQDVKLLYAIANPSETHLSAKPSTVSDLLVLTDDFTNAPVSPFLMSGKANINGNNINIALVRSVAKIVVIGEDGFQVQSVTVKDTPSKGFVFAQTTLSVPPSSNRVDYTDISNSTIYVAENSKQNPTTLIVKGTVAGVPVKEKIFTFEKNGQPIDIERNFCYKATISFDGQNADISFNIVEWNDIDLDPLYFEY